MEESFLHALWKQQLFEKRSDWKVEGEPLLVLHTGVSNRNAGPDFEQAKVKIGNLEWAGSVEIHVKASEWNAHQHQHDPAYQSVILHVVWEKDTEVKRKDGSLVPTFEVRHLVSLEVLLRYRKLIEAKDQPIPCLPLLDPSLHMRVLAMQERVLVERLQRKAADIARRQKENKGNWEETLFQTVGWSLGLKVNAESMLNLTYGIPIKWLAAQNFDPRKTAPLLLGMAGLIDAGKGPASRQIASEFALWQAKYGVEALNLNWKRFRLRPGAFPEQRLLLLAHLAGFVPDWIEQMDDPGGKPSFPPLIFHPDSDQIFQEYLNEMHCPPSRLAWTDFLKNQLIINVFAPVLAAVGVEKDHYETIIRAVDWLADAKPEKNERTRLWEKAGFNIKNAAESQAFLELLTGWCQKKRCMECQVGAGVLAKS